MIFAQVERSHGMERSSAVKRVMVRPQRHAAMKREEYMDYTDIIEELEEEEEPVPSLTKPAPDKPPPRPTRGTTPLREHSARPLSEQTANLAEGVQSDKHTYRVRYFPSVQKLV